MVVEDGKGSVGMIGACVFIYLLSPKSCLRFSVDLGLC